MTGLHFTLEGVFGCTYHKSSFKPRNCRWAGPAQSKQCLWRKTSQAPSNTVQ